MEKIEYIRTMESDTKSVLLIFRVISDCYLSDFKLKFEHGETMFLPKIKISKGDFIWITNMESEEVDQITSNNSSNTNTLILQVEEDNFNLLDYQKLENV